MVSGWGKPGIPLSSPWSICTAIALTGISRYWSNRVCAFRVLTGACMAVASVSQTFFARRLWRLTHSLALVLVILTVQLISSPSSRVVIDAMFRRIYSYLWLSVLLPSLVQWRLGSVVNDVGITGLNIFQIIVADYQNSTELSTFEELSVSILSNSFTCLSNQTMLRIDMAGLQCGL